MYISRLQLANYRNYARVDVQLDRGISLFIGDNAQGKSNLLEAIYLLSTMRSSRASNDSDLVRHEVLAGDFPFARLEADVDRAAGQMQIELVVIGRSTDGSHRAGKRVRLNGAGKRMSDAVGELAAVLFTTLDIELVAGPPLLRRRYLDMMISQVDRGYLRAMQRYASILPQRNSLLRRIHSGEASQGELPFWDQELAHAGGTIFRARAEALGSVVLAAREQMQTLSDSAERLDITYRPAIGGLNETDSPIDDSGWIQRMLRAMQQQRRREIATGTTVIGPHRDDFSIEIDGNDAASFASRAQQRTAALALRVAEANYLRTMLGDDPVVLLDDVLSELDARRRKGVLSFLDSFQQVFITSADPDRVRDVMTRASGRFVVRDGALTRFEGE